MQLFYDERDDRYHKTHGSEILYWLDDLGARPLSEASVDQPGFLFTGARSIEDYDTLVKPYPAMRDRPSERAPLLRLDRVLDALNVANVDTATPRTWVLPLDATLPDDLTFPLFVRTAFTSLKLGGHISRVRTPAQLVAEMAELRRALGWDATILAREWCDLASAGTSVYGPVSLEVRTWIVDQEPFAWSFHYLNVVDNPMGFPLGQDDLSAIRAGAQRVGRAFDSRLVAADFARDAHGVWIFIEAGPGSCAGTAHQSVFKSVASRLIGRSISCHGNAFGGRFDQM